MKRLIAACVALSLGGCTSADKEASDSPPRLPPLDSEIEMPQLALADHVLGTYFASDVAMRPTVCIATTDGREEVALEQGWERELMARYPALAPFSRCALLDGVWQDAETGEPAMVFSLHSFTCTTANSCSGFGQYMFGQTTSPTSRYKLDWGGKRWNFTRDDRLLGEP
ncbi:hypothetical protein [Alteraurantiacibacter palmitatis]|uniref:Lipoprotein n=1 Tax=Alteraurantiacibacter palmitatis TaxID=2054628 RepID=A0ABV7E4C3_9SPHN